MFFLNLNITSQVAPFNFPIRHSCGIINDLVFTMEPNFIFHLCMTSATQEPNTDTGITLSNRILGNHRGKTAVSKGFPRSGL